ncbi:energy transducer TonB [Desulfuromonas sp.]|uniref:energy transducer TonB n=1 Tax=Desulfuromonas sp. TaxID=892 RepID=UPI0025B7B4E7|nr:energy transducer TonB [Desulfuromonas sp.]
MASKLQDATETSKEAVSAPVESIPAVLSERSGGAVEEEVSSLPVPSAGFLDEQSGAMSLPAKAASPGNASEQGESVDRPGSPPEGDDGGSSAGEGQVLVEAQIVPGQNAPPAYPPIARQRGWEGEVWIRAQVGDDGRVSKAWVEEHSDYAVLDRAALDAVGRWRFRPALQGKRPVASVVRLPIRFELRRGG